MKKLFNKLSYSGKMEDDMHEDEEILDINYRKPTALPADVRDNSEDIKMKRSINKKALSKSKDSLEVEEDFHKKKSSSGSVKSHKSSDKNKLHESDDKVAKKSFSMRTASLFKSSDQIKDPDSMKSPSLKSVYVSEYEEPQEELDGSDSEDDAAVPRRGSSVSADDGYSTTPLRVPSAPGRMSSYAPPRIISLSPRSVSPTAYTPSTPPSMSLNQSPSPVAHVPSNSFPRSASSPPAVISTYGATPHVVVADDFDTRFASKKSVSDETAFGSEYGATRSDYAQADDRDTMTDDGDDT